METTRLSIIYKQINNNKRERTFDGTNKRLVPTVVINAIRRRRDENPKVRYIMFIYTYRIVTIRPALNLSPINRIISLRHVFFFAVETVLHIKTDERGKYFVELKNARVRTKRVI